MEKNGYILAIAAIILCLSSVADADFNAFQVSLSNSSVNTIASYNITLNHSIATDLTNITIIFPAGFVVSSANVTGATNLPANGTTNVTDQNVTYNFDSFPVTPGANISITIANVLNPNVTSSYLLEAVTFNETTPENVADHGNTSFSITPGAVFAIHVNYSISNLAAGVNFTGNVTSTDRFGNLVSDTYNFTTSDSQGMLPANNSTNTSNLDFSLKTAGNYTISVLSRSNSSAANTTYFFVSPASVAFIRAYYSATVVLAGINFTGNFTSRDAFGNYVNDTYNFTVEDTNSTYPANMTLANNTNDTFTLGTPGSSTIIAWSMNNVSVTNTTTIYVNSNSACTIQIVLSANSTTANQPFSANISSYDCSGTPVSDSYSFTSSDPLAVLPSTGTINGSGINFTLRTSGNRSITVKSLLNSSANVTTYILINATAISQVLLIPHNPSVNVYVGVQFVATLVDIYGNVNSAFLPSYNISILLGSGNMTSSGYFYPLIAGIIAVSASYANIWNTTNVTISSPTPTPSPTASTDTSTSNPGSTTPDYIVVPTLSARTLAPSPTPTPSPAPPGSRKIIETPTPTPVPYKSDSEGQISALQKELADAKASGQDTASIEKLLATAQDYYTKGNYKLAYDTAKQARNTIASMIRATATTSAGIEIVDKKGGLKWEWIIAIVVIVSIGVYSYINFAEKQYTRIHQKHVHEAPPAVEKKEVKGKHKGEVDLVD
ncbi:MAG: hypothetical protein V1835_05545 [Candidatus Micrarchaeota archaeon]